DVQALLHFAHRFVWDHSDGRALRVPRVGAGPVLPVADERDEIWSAVVARRLVFFEPLGVGGSRMVVFRLEHDELVHRVPDGSGKLSGHNVVAERVQELDGDLTPNLEGDLPAGAFAGGLLDTGRRVPIADVDGHHRHVAVRLQIRLVGPEPRLVDRGQAPLRI